MQVVFANTAKCIFLSRVVQLAPLLVVFGTTCMSIGTSATVAAVAAAAAAVSTSIATQKFHCSSSYLPSFGFIFIPAIQPKHNLKFMT